MQTILLSSTEWIKVVDSGENYLGQVDSSEGVYFMDSAASPSVGDVGLILNRNDTLSSEVYPVRDGLWMINIRHTDQDVKFRCDKWS
ncbi:UmuD-like protein [Thiohalocapsa phage LS06-2018-MD03]|nr:UmuD-like protein [Thiohalocapsa phage LS06-2018-MD03]